MSRHSGDLTLPGGQLTSLASCDAVVTNTGFYAAGDVGAGIAQTINDNKQTYQNQHHIETQSLRGHHINMQPDLDTLSLTSKPRRSVRIRDNMLKQKLLVKLNTAIDMQGEVNFMLTKELKKSNPSFDRLQCIRSDLAANLKHIHSLHDEYKLSVVPNKDTSQRVDRITHDNLHISQQVDQMISDMSVRSKRAQSVHSMHSKESLKRSSSRGSRFSDKSSSSVILRLRASEAAAKAAELEAQLLTEKQTRQIEQQLSKLESTKRELKLQGELEAEKRKAAIFQQAMIEEEQLESGLLLRPNSNPARATHTLSDIPDERAPQPSELEACIHANQQRLESKSRVHFATTHLQMSELDSDDDLELPPTVGTPQVKPSEFASPVVSALSSSQHSAANNASSVTNGLAEAISSAFNMARLPPPEPFIFDGDPLKYPDWIFAFDNLIDNKRCGVIEKLHYLKRYVSGRALAVVEGYFLLQSQDAYQRAREDLRKRFGNPFIISEAFRTKIKHWPAIKPRDGEGLRCFSDFLQQCNTAQLSIADLRVLDDNRENKKMLQKLPEGIAHRWVRYVTTYTQKHGAFPKFSVFCRFVSKEAEIACNPLLKDFMSQNIKSELLKRRHEKQTFATQQIEQKLDKTTSVVNKTSMHNQYQKQCVHCNMTNHSTARCGKVKNLSFKEQQDFMRSNQLCFACLQGKHSYKTCPAPEVCDLCQGAHPTCLHNLRTKSNKSAQNRTHQEPVTEQHTSSIAAVHSNPISQSEIEKSQDFPESS